jgi:hypothetical protein
MCRRPARARSWSGPIPAKSFPSPHFEQVFGYLLQRGAFRLETSEVFGDGDRLAGHFTATLTAHGSGETVSVDQTELYEVTDGVISKVEVFQNNTPALIEFFARNAPAS